jgi:hypothetical protein
MAAGFYARTVRAAGNIYCTSPGSIAAYLFSVNRGQSFPA